MPQISSQIVHIYQIANNNINYIPLQCLNNVIRAKFSTTAKKIHNNAMKPLLICSTVHISSISVHMIWYPSLYSWKRVHAEVTTCNKINEHKTLYTDGEIRHLGWAVFQPTAWSLEKTIICLMGLSFQRCQPYKFKLPSSVFSHWTIMYLHLYKVVEKAVNILLICWTEVSHLV